MTRAAAWMRAWTWTCHWSGVVCGRSRRASSSAAGDGAEVSTSRQEPWSGNPSRHSAAQMMVPPGLTTLAAAEIPLTAWAARARLVDPIWHVIDHRSRQKNHPDRRRRRPGRVRGYPTAPTKHRQG